MGMSEAAVMSATRRCSCRSESAFMGWPFQHESSDRAEPVLKVAADEVEGNGPTPKSVLPELTSEIILESARNLSERGRGTGPFWPLATGSPQSASSNEIGTS